MKIADGFHCFSLFVSGIQRLHHLTLPLVAIDTIDYKTKRFKGSKGSKPAKKFVYNIITFKILKYSDLSKAVG